MGIVALKNLQAGFNFRVNLVGLNNQTILKVQKVELPSAIQVEERVHFERGDKKILAGTTSRDGTLTLESVIPNGTPDREYLEFVNLLRDTLTDQSSLPNTYMKSIIIQELNELGTPIRNHVFSDCVLNKYELPSFDSGSSENAIEKLIFFVNGYSQ